MKRKLLNKSILPYVYLISFILISGLIIFFSLSSADQSSEQSAVFVDMFVWLFGLFGYVPPPDVLGVIDTLVRKLIGHFGLFFIDGIFGYLTFASFVHIRKKWLPLVISLGVTLVLAIGGELLQLLASGRAMLFGDVIFNYAGAFTGITLIYLLINKQTVKEQTHMKRIVLAGGCFWGVEAYYKLLKGVIDTEVGYTNGNFDHPSYQDLIKHRATHAEAVAITYDEKQITLETLLEHMFRFIDPTSIDQQGNDIGHQYRSGVYYKDVNDKEVINAFLNKKAALYKKPLAIEVVPETGFFTAEDYHQDYLDKNPYGYCHVNLGLVKKEERK